MDTIQLSYASLCWAMAILHRCLRSELARENVSCAVCHVREGMEGRRSAKENTEQTTVPGHRARTTRCVACAVRGNYPNCSLRAWAIRLATRLSGHPSCSSLLWATSSSLPAWSCGPDCRGTRQKDSRPRWDRKSTALEHPASADRRTAARGDDRHDSSGSREGIRSAGPTSRSSRFSSSSTLT
jgi:hypothetical protein